MPTHFYKIIVVKDGGTYKSIAFVMPNVATYKPPFNLPQYIQSIAWIEDHTGLTFMPNLTAAQRIALKKKQVGHVAMNNDLPYRPLLGGVSIMNARINEPGTLGYFGRDALGATWIISAYHVLCNSDLSPYVADEPIYQPAAVDPSCRVALTRAARANVQLDCAAALIDAGISVLNAQLGLGTVIAPKEAVLGMRLCKSGAVTGVTEGIVTQIRDDTIEITADISFDRDYVLSDAGDSGSLWVEQGTRAPVCLHRGRATPRLATAGSILAVLAALQLQPLPAMPSA